MSAPILEVRDLAKSYGSVEALRGVSFFVEAGEVFGLLGPNGAGKTTTVEILEGLRTLDGGSVSVCGLDPQKHGGHRKVARISTYCSSILPKLGALHLSDADYPGTSSQRPQGSH